MNRPNAPSTARAIRDRLRNHVGRDQGWRQPLGRAEHVMAVVIVGQMLPESIIKGGGAMQARLGHSSARATRDLDVTRVSDVDVFIAEAQQRLAEGWQGFTGVLEPGEPRAIAGVPDGYVARRAKIRLRYRGSDWLTVRLDIAHDEIDAVERAELVLANETAQLFDAVGLPQPDPVAVMAPVDQIAQKLHACTNPRSAADRVTDVVDLQQLIAVDHDLTEAAATVERTFAYRRRHPMPRHFPRDPSWTDEQYSVASHDLTGVADVAATLDQAVETPDHYLQRLRSAAAIAGRERLPTSTVVDL